MLLVPGKTSILVMLFLALLVITLISEPQVLVMMLTDFRHIEENEGAATNDVYCDRTKAAEYPCVAGKKYYGRGPLQLS